MRNTYRVGSATPGVQTMQLLIRSSLVLIFIDELSIYLRKFRGTQGRQASEQRTTFLIALIKTPC
jgi:hypothetical protein